VQIQCAVNQQDAVGLILDELEAGLSPTMQRIFLKYQSLLPLRCHWTAVRCSSSACHICTHSEQSLWLIGTVHAEPETVISRPGFNPQTGQNKLFQDYWRARFEINFSDRQEGLTVSSIICDR